MKRRGWTKQHRENFMAAMKAKRNGVEPRAVFTTANPPMVLSAVLTITERWDREANEAFAALPFERKAALLAQVKEGEVKVRHADLR